MSKMDYQLSKQVMKFLLKRDSHFLSLFYQKIEMLCEDPFTSFVDTKKMQGVGPDIYRLRVGKYRFLYRIYADQILIYFYEADTRGDLY